MVNIGRPVFPLIAGIPTKKQCQRVANMQSKGRFNESGPPGPLLGQIGNTETDGRSSDRDET